MKSKLSEWAQKLMQTEAGQQMLKLPKDRQEKLVELAAMKLILEAKKSKVRMKP